MLVNSQCRLTLAPGLPRRLEVRKYDDEEDSSFKGSIGESCSELQSWPLVGTSIHYQLRKLSSGEDDVDANREKS